MISVTDVVAKSVCVEVTVAYSVLYAVDVIGSRLKAEEQNPSAGTGFPRNPRRQLSPLQSR